MSGRIAAKTLIVQYLLHLKMSGTVEDVDNLEIAIDCLKDAFNLKQVTTGSSELEDVITGTKKPTVSMETPSQLKDKGNAAFKDGKFREAVELFTQAVDASVELKESSETRAVYFANRAAARMSLKNNLDRGLAISDCKAALELSPSYHKASFRLGNLYEELDDKEHARDAYAMALRHDAANAKYKEALKRVGGSIEDAPAPHPSAVPSPSMDSSKVNELLEKFPMLEEMKNDPDFLNILQNPKVLGLMQQMQSNPMAALSALQDPELAPIFSRLMEKLAPSLGGMMGNLGNLFGSGGPGGNPPGYV